MKEQPLPEPRASLRGAHFMATAATKASGRLPGPTHPPAGSVPTATSGLPKSPSEQVRSEQQLGEAGLATKRGPTGAYSNWESWASAVRLFALGAAASDIFPRFPGMPEHASL